MNTYMNGHAVYHAQRIMEVWLWFDDFGGSVGGSYIEAAAAPPAAVGVLIMLII